MKHCSVNLIVEDHITTTIALCLTEFLQPGEVIEKVCGFERASSALLSLSQTLTVNLLHARL